jgi:hypothetical protein
MVYFNGNVLSEEAYEDVLRDAPFSLAPRYRTGEEVKVGDIVGHGLGYRYVIVSVNVPPRGTWAQAAITCAPDDWAECAPDERSESRAPYPIAPIPELDFISREEV